MGVQIQFLFEESAVVTLTSHSSASAFGKKLEEATKTLLAPLSLNLGLKSSDEGRRHPSP